MFTSHCSSNHGKLKHTIKEEIMARISGVDLPNEKRVEIGLTYI